MKKVEITSEVLIPSIGKIIHNGILEFDDKENDFGRVLEYRRYMKELFPGCEYKLIKAKDIN